MSLSKTKLNRAELVKELMHARDAIDAALDTLMPADEEDEDCQHPAAAIEDITEELGEDRYRCNACGLVRTTPFNEE